MSRRRSESVLDKISKRDFENFELNDTAQKKTEKAARLSIDSFIKNHFKKKNLTSEEKRKNLAEFETELLQIISSSSLDISSQKTLEDSMKDLLYQKLWNRYLELPENQTQDRILQKKFQDFSWIQPFHLEIDKKQWNPELWDVAKKELFTMSSFLKPSEKLMLILNCSKILSFLIQESGTLASADDFLPHVVYVTVHSQLTNIHSNLNYISDYVSDEYLQGETYYFFTNLVSSVLFIAKLDHTGLNIDEEEYYQLMNIRVPKKRYKVPKALSKEQARRSMRTLGTSGLTSEDFENEKPVSKEHERKKISLKSLSNEFPYFGVPIESIKPENIRGLLWGYQELALRLVLSSESIDVNPNILQNIPLVVKVKEKTEEFFKLVSITKRTISELHSAILIRLEKPNSFIQSLLLIPNTLIEKNEDLYFLEDNVEIEVQFTS